MKEFIQATKLNATVFSCDHQNVLHMAAIHGHLNVREFALNCRLDEQGVKETLKHGIFTHCPDVDFETPLALAIKLGHLFAAEKLIEYGCHDATINEILSFEFDTQHADCHRVTIVK